MFGDWGMPPMAGRVLGWLLLCDPPHQTAAQVGDKLGASKGSISTMLRHLLGAGIIERVAVPGQRSRCFRLREGCWSEHMQNRMAMMRELRALAERGLDLMQGADARLLQRLQDFRDLHAFLERELPSMLERYQRESKTANGVER